MKTSKTNHKHIVHFIPPVKFAELEKEFVEPRPDDYFIWWLFDHRCVECKRKGTEINEIVPRSRSKSAIMDWKNRIVLCRGCHVEYHRTGVSPEKMQKMREHRRSFLLMLNKGSYV